jgi:phospholipase/carboxylesterase
MSISTENLEAVYYNPKIKPKASVIWLHGLGADGHDFVPIVPQLQLPEELGVRFIFPHAPARPVSINAGMTMRAWFDIFGLTPGSKQDEAGIRKAEQLVTQLIKQENDLGIPSKKIVLAGFSQGGALALQCGLRYPERLAGIMGLSTVLALAEKLPQELSAANKDIPIFLAHGTQDMLVPLTLGEMMRQYLESMDYAVSWKTYPMAHSVCQEEIHDISNWLQKVI